MDWLHWILLIVALTQFPLAYVGWILVRLVWKTADIGRREMGKNLNATEIVRLWVEGFEKLEADV